MSHVTSHIYLEADSTMMESINDIHSLTDNNRRIEIKSNQHVINKEIPRSLGTF